MFAGEIVAMRRVLVGLTLLADAALGRDGDMVAHTRNCFERAAEHLLGESVAVNVREIEHRVAGLIGGGDGFAALLFMLLVYGGMRNHPRDAPATVGEAAAFQAGFSQVDRLHD